MVWTRTGDSGQPRLVFTVQSGSTAHGRQPSQTISQRPHRRTVDPIGTFVAAADPCGQASDCEPSRATQCHLLRPAHRLCMVGVAERFSTGRDGSRLLPPVASSWSLAVDSFCQWVLEIVKRNDDVKGFKHLPKRWVVERTFSWLSNCRRLSKHYEYWNETSEAMIHVAMIQLMLRRLTKKNPDAEGS